MQIFKIILFLFLPYFLYGQSDYYYPLKNSEWETKSPSDFNIEINEFNQVIEMAKEKQVPKPFICAVTGHTEEMFLKQA